MKYQIFFLALLIAGCNTTERAQRSFASTLDFYVENKFTVRRLAEFHGHIYHEEALLDSKRYFFSHAHSKYTDSRCKWVVTEKKGVIVDWNYISRPEYCYKKFSWAAPW